MNTEDLLVRRALVLGSALLYWGGVWIQAHRVRKRIGRSPNVEPRGSKERLLWLGWLIVVAAWIALPFLARTGASSGWIRPLPALLGQGALIGGIVLLFAGHAGTLWCYRVLGDRWRMGVDRRAQGPLATSGPYSRVRHPIYFFQVIILAAVALLLPVAAASAIMALHLVCVVIKALDEEGHLLKTHGDAYRQYQQRTGMLFPTR
jgi:steroid 5-alpha reductase family enzyme